MNNKQTIVICVLIITAAIVVAGVALYFNLMQETSVAIDLDEINKGDNLTLSLVDGNGTPLENKTLVITINGVTYNQTTDGAGCTQLPIGLDPGDYVVTVEFEGDYIYKSSNITKPLKVIEKVESQQSSQSSQSSSSVDEGAIVDEMSGDHRIIHTGEIQLGADDHHWKHLGHNKWVRID